MRSPKEQASRQEFQASPQKFLFLSLDETVQDNRPSAEKRFQSFVVPNPRITLPIPFALDIDSPKDCPSELELDVGAEFRKSRDLGDEAIIRGAQALNRNAYDVVGYQPWLLSGRIARGNSFRRSCKNKIARI